MLDIVKEMNSKIAIFRDPNFIFEEEAHVYTYNGTKYDSVTTFIKNFKEPFDKEYWSKRKAKELGVDPSTILNEWEGKANTANVLGTDVHKWIEDFWSGDVRELNPEKEDPILIERVGKFMEIYEKRLKNLIPLQPELRIFSKKWRLAGTIDQPFLVWEPKLQKYLFILGDWKTNKEFKTDEHPKGRYKKLKHPFSNLYENNLNEYSIQISLYRLILEEELGVETHSGFLCHIGPDGPAKIYPTKDLRSVLKVYLEHNREDFDIFNV
jgi:hypothetical protein